MTDYIYLDKQAYQRMLDEFDFMLQRGHYQDIPTNENGVNLKLKFYNHRDAAHLTLLSGINTIQVRLEGWSLSNYFETDVSGFGQFLYHQYFYEHWMSATTGNNTITNICSSNIAISDNGTIENNITATDYSNTAISNRDYIKYLCADGGKSNANERVIENEKENKEMKGINFDFGPCNGNVVRMSMYGMAVKNFNDTFVAYDPKTDTIMDVDVFNFNGEKFFYKMPVPIKDIAKGDVVIHNRRPCFVLDFGPNDKSLYVVDPIDGEKKEIMLTHSPFGFNFATKVISLMDMCGQVTPSADNPFGNMWMFAMADGNMNDMLPLMMMANGGGGNMNPMMMYFMMSNNNKDNLLPLMFMMNNNN